MVNVGRRLSTVRGRSTALAMAAVAGALILGSLVLLWAFKAQLEANLAASLETEAQARVALLDQGADPSTLVSSNQDEALVWIGTPAGDAVAMGGDIEPLENPIPPTVGVSISRDLEILERGSDSERETHEVLLASAQTADGSLVVVTGAETEAIRESLGGLARLIAVAIPILTAIVGGLAWHTVGRALQPVERIRTQALSISGHTLGERVPVPKNTDEIHDLASSMNEMLDRLEAHEHATRQFSADASHELKSPVANVRALIDTASISDDGWPDLQRQLAGETDRLRDLVDNLLFLSTSSAGRPVASEQVELDELLFAEAELLAATGRVTVDLSRVEPASLTGSGRDLSRLVRNLVDNAARHAKSKVQLGIEHAAGSVVLIVGDDGPGIHGADRDRVFERFTRLDHARARDDGGSGLGLAIVSYVAEAHNADVTIGDSPLGGAEFRAIFRTQIFGR